MRNLGLIDLPFSLLPQTVVPTPTNQWNQQHQHNTATGNIYYLDAAVGTVRLQSVPPANVVDGGWLATAAAPITTEAVLAAITGDRTWTWWMKGTFAPDGPYCELLRCTMDPPWGFALYVRRSDTGVSIWPVFDYQWSLTVVSIPNQYCTIDGSVWQHWALTWSVSTGVIVLYVNGAEIARFTGASYNPPKKTMTLKWPGWNCTSGPFDVYLSDARAFAAALSSNEVAAVFACGRQQI